MATFVLENEGGNPASDAYVFNFNWLMQHEGADRAFAYLFRYAFHGTGGMDPGFNGTGWHEQMIEHFGAEEARRIVGRLGASAESALGRWENLPLETPKPTYSRPTRPARRRP